MDNYNPDVFWQCVLVFFSLGMFFGVTCLVIYRMVYRLLATGVMFISFCVTVYLLIMMSSMAVLVMDFFFVDSRYFIFDVVLFSSFAAYSFRFSSIAHQRSCVIQ